MATKPKLAVIGAGVIGRTHIETIMGMPGVTLAAIVEPGPQGAVLAQRLGVPLYPDPGALIAAGGIDGAVVATPNDTHLPVSQALLESGIAVLLEKPVADSLDAAAQLVALTRRCQTPLLVGHHRRHNPIVKAAREAIASGLIGDLVVANVVTTLRKPDDYFHVDWRRTAGTGGPLLINLIHEIDLLRHFFGEIAQVQAQSSHARRGFAVEDSAAITLRLESGADRDDHLGRRNRAMGLGYHRGRKPRAVSGASGFGPSLCRQQGRLVAARSDHLASCRHPGLDQPDGAGTPAGSARRSLYRADQPFCRSDRRTGRSADPGQ